MREGFVHTDDAVLTGPWADVLHNLLPSRGQRDATLSMQVRIRDLKRRHKRQVDTRTTAEIRLRPNERQV